MDKVRNIVFVIIAAVVFFAVLGYKGLDMLEVVEAPDNSTLEGRAYASVPALTAGTVAGGEFQNDAEAYLADHVPSRDSFMLANATWQRGVIKAANVPFGWPCYPTYFESGRIYIPECDAVSYVPTEWKKSKRKGLKKFAAALGTYADKHPETRFVLYLVPAYEAPAVNPAYDLVTDPMTAKKALAAMRDGLGAGARVKLLSDEFDDVESFYKHYFRTDHHWNIYGAVRAYNAIADSLGMGPFDVGDVDVLEGESYTGATSRWGLDVIKEPVFDSAHHFDSVTHVSDDGALSSADDHDAYWNLPKERRANEFYDQYYGNLEGGYLKGPGTGRCLLVCNSFGDAVQRIFAEQYSATRVERTLHPSHENEQIDLTVNDAIANHVVFVGSVNDYASFMKRNPHFFD